MRKVLFIGAVNRGNLPADGETAKNQILLAFLEERYGRIQLIDTFHWKRSPLIWWRLVFNIVFARGKTVLLSACTKSSYAISRLFNSFKRQGSLYYFVIGNSIAAGIESSNYKPKYYRQYRKIYVEGHSMVRIMRQHGLNNVEYLPNFKPIENKHIKTIKKSHIANLKVNFVFLSRICEEKGVSIIFDSMATLNNEGLEVKYSVTFLGPVSAKFQDRFIYSINNFKNAKHGGFLNLREETGYSLLSQYDVMLFPSFWEGEGFPGVLVDALIAGIPVIATDWHLNSEIIEEGKTGWLIKPYDVIALAEKMKYVINNREQLVEMSAYCMNRAPNYDYRRVLNVVDIS